METLRAVSGRLTERRFDRIHLHGPGTDLTVGLFPSSQWQAAGLFLMFQLLWATPHSQLTRHLLALPIVACVTFLAVLLFVAVPNSSFRGGEV